MSFFFSFHFFLKWRKDDHTIDKLHCICMAFLCNVALISSVSSFRINCTKASLVLCEASNINIYKQANSWSQNRLIVMEIWYDSNHNNFSVHVSNEHNIGKLWWHCLLLFRKSQLYNIRVGIISIIHSIVALKLYSVFTPQQYKRY